jgi:5-methylthioribose kinase
MRGYFGDPKYDQGALLASLLLLRYTQSSIQAMDNNKEAWKEVLETIHKHRSVFKQQLDTTNMEQMTRNLDPNLLAAIQIYAR